MAARDNLNSALSALESAAASAGSAIDQHIASVSDVMGSGDVQAAADRVFNVVNGLNAVIAKLTPKS